jgi:hypothetical protein
VKKCDDVMCPESSSRFWSFHAGAMLWKTPGTWLEPYQPRPKPSPFVGSAPRRECRLWSISELPGVYSASLSRIGEPE